MNISKLFIVIVIFSSLFNCKNEVRQDENKTTPKQYKPNWESLSEHKAAPEWFVDAKLGIYFHWGVYSVPAFGSAWYPRNMYIEDSKEYKYHKKTYGNVAEFGYHDFIPMFTAEHFNPEEWAELFKESGAKFAGPVAQHHDGFAMWQSKINPWNAYDMGPKRDILGELFKSLEKRDMKTIATFHHARHGQRNAKNPNYWGEAGYNSHYPYHPDLPTSTTDPELRKLYGNFEAIDEFNQYWLNQVNEVVDNYNPDIIWFDSWLNVIPEQYRQEMAMHFLNNGLKHDKELVICHKQEDMPMSLSVLDFEQGGRREINPMPWMTDITLGQSRWMYVEGHEYKNSALVIRNMIDVWSKNGVVLLNVSPRADGVIPDEQRQVLKDIGNWLKVHGEAVYGTRTFSHYGYGNAKTSAGHFGGQSAKTKYTADDVRFTVSKDNKTMYAFFLGKPESGKRIEMRPLGLHRYPTRSPIKRITLLGTDIDTELKWELTPETFHLTMPDVEMNDLATVLKFELE
ncbi:alpha-L-fucosidase [Flavivirga amylovorans]|uniref:alpha-L-fucosidase n=1 Tax=Flavivirga amylovorans TaxID=870486 RepID=A0ABT8WZG7_9FLAO|nr:alpha-L-fucosidase [Flavivirga amylovorans]MDO5987075.1 alpha-L-fucosidase [Flavivirga amylovorans]